MNLREYEIAFTNALHPSADSNVFNNACELLVEHGSMTAEQRLLIYRHNISGAYISALSATYSVCEQILGEKCFAGFARDYAWGRTKQSKDLNELGKDFPEYIEQQVEMRLGFEGYSYLADLARLEWLIEKSVQAADSDMSGCVSDAMIEDCEPDKLFPIVNSSLYLLGTEYPILTLWKSHRQQNDNSRIAGLKDKEYLCICRDENDDVIILSISNVYFELLTLCLNKSLNDLAAAQPLKLVNFLQYAVEQGWLLGFRK